MGSFSVTLFFTVLAIFIVMVLIVRQEEVRNRRFFASSLRAWFDIQVIATERKIIDTWQHFLKYIVQLGWYYGLHSLLKGILKILVSVYTYIENIFERNRLRAKQLRSEKKQKVNNHLTKIASHKAQTALSPEQKSILKQKKFEDH
jgi:hypothetical protein